MQNGAHEPFTQLRLAHSSGLAHLEPSGKVQSKRTTVLCAHSVSTVAGSPGKDWQYPSGEHVAGAGQGTLPAPKHGLHVFDMGSHNLVMHSKFSTQGSPIDETHIATLHCLDMH